MSALLKWFSSADDIENDAPVASGGGDAAAVPAPTDGAAAADVVDAKPSADERAEPATSGKPSKKKKSAANEASGGAAAASAATAAAAADGGVGATAAVHADADHSRSQCCDCEDAVADLWCVQCSGTCHVCIAMICTRYTLWRHCVYSVFLCVRVGACVRRVFCRRGFMCRPQ